MFKSIVSLICVFLIGIFVYYTPPFFGPQFRDALLFSQVKHKGCQLTTRDCQSLLNPEIPDTQFPQKRAVLSAFTPTIHRIPFVYKGKTLEANLLIFTTNHPSSHKAHTTLRIGGSDEILEVSPIRIMPYLSAALHSPVDLTFIQLSFYDIFEDNAQWKPTSFSEIGQMTSSLIGALKERGLVKQIDSMICHSMGASVLEGLEPSDIPPTLIFDRAMPSSWKVISKQYSPPLSHLLYALAHLSNWTTDCEDKLISHHDKLSRVIIIETEKDFYFSKNSSFSSKTVHKLKELGVEVFHHKFFVNTLRYHERAHHAVSLQHLVNTSLEPLSSQTFSIQPHEDVASAIVHSVFE